MNARKYTGGTRPETSKLCAGAQSFIDSYFNELGEYTLTH
jgi:hypothetical protein